MGYDHLRHTHAESVNRGRFSQKEREKQLTRGIIFCIIPLALKKRTISSAGMSIRLTCGGSQVRVLYRPPKRHRSIGTVSFFLFLPQIAIPAVLWTAGISACRKTRCWFKPASCFCIGNGRKRQKRQRSPANPPTNLPAFSNSCTRISA